MCRCASRLERSPWALRFSATRFACSVRMRRQIARSVAVWVFSKRGCLLILKGYGLRRIGAPQPVSQLTSDAHGLGELEVVARGSVCGAGKVRSRGIDRGVCGKRADLRGANGEDVEDLRRGSRLRRRRAGSRSEWRWGW